jgi:hypothetical protein
VEVEMFFSLVTAGNFEFFLLIFIVQVFDFEEVGPVIIQSPAHPFSTEQVVQLTFPEFWLSNNT